MQCKRATLENLSFSLSAMLCQNNNRDKLELRVYILRHVFILHIYYEKVLLCNLCFVVVLEKDLKKIKKYLAVIW